MCTSIVIYAKKLALSKQGKYKGLRFALVGYWWYEWLNIFRWYSVKPHNTYYAHRIVYINNKQCKVYLHALILRRPAIGKIDHADGDGLNNTESNLRIATNSQNAANKKNRKNKLYKFIGVYRGRKNNFNVYIQHNKRQQFLGTFTSQIEAAKVYDKKAKELHGEFATLNFIDDTYTAD